MNEIKGVLLKCKRPVDVVELNIIIRYVFIQLRACKKIFLKQQMIVLKARHCTDVKTQVFLSSPMS